MDKNSLFVKAADVVGKTLDEIKDSKKDKDDVNAFPTGFEKLDELTGGFRPGELIVIASRPSMGKTNFALNIVHDQVIKNKRKIAYISFSERKEDILKRLLIMDSYICEGQIRSGELKETEWKELNKSAKKIGKSGLILCDDPEIDPAEIPGICNELKSEYGINGIIIDHLQMLTGNGKAPDDDRANLKLLRRLKQAAVESEIPMILISQLSRKVEKRPDKRPWLSDFIEGNVIADSVDTVLFIYRDDYYYPDSGYRNIAEIIIAKHKRAGYGHVYLGWNPGVLRYMNIDEDIIDKIEEKEGLYRDIDEIFDVNNMDELPFN